MVRPEKGILIDNTEIDVNVDLITMQEFQESLKKLKNRKLIAVKIINSELIKYRKNILQQRKLNLFNICWLKCNVPKE